MEFQTFEMFFVFFVQISTNAKHINLCLNGYLEGGVIKFATFMLLKDIKKF